MLRPNQIDEVWSSGTLRKRRINGSHRAFTIALQHPSQFLYLIAFLLSLASTFIHINEMNFCAHFSNHSILFNFFSFNYFFIFRIQRWFCFCYVQCAYNFICVVYSTYLLVSDAPTTSKCSMNMNNGIFIPWSSAYFSTNTNLFLITTNSKHTHRKRKKLHDTKWQLCA